MMRDDEPIPGLTIGSVPYTNAYPLWHRLPYRCIFAPPAELYKRMCAKECDVALLPTAALLYHPEWIRVANTCIASDGPVESVKLFHSKPIAECRLFGLDPESLTSTLLLKIVLRDHYRLTLDQLEFRLLHPPFSGKTDAFLLIGDKALAFQDPNWESVDLGTVWKALTGLPFVYAVWLSRHPLENHHAFASQCERGLVEAMESINDWLPGLARDRSLLLEDLWPYFKQSLKFKLTESCEKGLQRFLTQAALLT